MRPRNFRIAWEIHERRLWPCARNEVGDGYLVEWANNAKSRAVRDGHGDAEVRIFERHVKAGGVGFPVTCGVCRSKPAYQCQRCGSTDTAAHLSFCDSYPEALP